MRKKSLRDLLLLIGIFGLIWAGFSLLPVFPEKTKSLVSVEQETNIGKKIIDAYTAPGGQMEVIDNDVVNSFIDSIVMILEPNIQEKVFEYNFLVIDNTQVNAFAMPGGNIIIYSGLIEFADSPEEVAGIIAHEIGHIEKRHIINRLVKKLGLSILLSGDFTVLTEVGHTAISTVFDRKQEREADVFAFKLLERSDISPRIIATFFRKLEEEGNTYNENLQILMTHPHHTERIKASLSYKLDSSFTEVKLPFDIDLIKSELN